jgi:WD40 repeat protein
MKRVLGIALAALLSAGGTAGGEDVPSRPFLRIETGMHTAGIVRIDTDAAGHFLVTGSLDKTVRVWDLASGLLLRTLRPPTGENDHEGQTFAVAISPDGELVAAGGFNLDIYLFDRQSGRLLRRLSGLPAIAIGLAFSPDGSRLAATLGGSTGLRVFRMPDGHEMGKDIDYGGDSFGVAFAADGRLATTSYDGKIRLYGRDLHLLASVSAPGGKQPSGVAFSPDGRRIALGYTDVLRVDVLDATDLSDLYVPDTRGTLGTFLSVTWSADGTFLYAAGAFGNSEGVRLVRRWNDAGRGTFQDFGNTESLILTLHVLPLGRLVFGSFEPAWGVLDASGKSNLGQRSSIADLHDLAGGFRVDSGGMSIRFAYDRGKRPARFSISNRRLLLDPPEDPRLAPPRTSAPGLEYAGTGVPNLNGQPLALTPSETVGNLAVAPDGQSFLLGTSQYLRAFSRDGSQRWSVPVPYVFTGTVNLTGDGRLAVATLGDGTIHWYRADNGKELLAFFPHADGKRWVLWTPSGYYDASVDGEDLIGWHVNNGPDREADFFSAWHFRERFYKPEVIDLILEAGVLAQAKGAVAVRREELPPVVTILDPADGADVTAPTLKIRVNVRSPSGKPITRVWAKVDGQAIESRAAEYVPADSPSSDSTRDFERSLEVPLPPGDHIIEALADVAGRVSTPASITVKRKAQAPPTTHRLFALVVGIAEYAKAEYKLSFADDDARAVAALLRGQKGKTFETVEVRDLIDQAATLDALIDGLQWLDESVGPEDTAVVFFAGHGVNDREYFFLPYDANLARPVATMLSQSQLQGIITRLRGQVLLFLDTCRAGAVFGGSDDDRRRRVDVTALVNGLTTSPRGLVVFSAAQGRELSQERPAWGHGAFTKALLEALQGGADAQGNRNGEITIAELDSFLTDRVRELTDRAQTSIQIKSPGVPIFTFLKVARP